MQCLHKRKIKHEDESEIVQLLNYFNYINSPPRYPTQYKYRRHDQNSFHAMVCTQTRWNTKMTEKVKYFNYSIKKTYKLDSSQYSIADIIKIHPCNGLHKRKIEHDDESEIVQLVK